MSSVNLQSLIHVLCYERGLILEISQRYCHTEKWMTLDSRKWISDDDNDDVVDNGVVDDDD